MPNTKTNDQQNSHKIYCKSVAESISHIVRSSLDEDFRKQSFELFGVSSSKEVEKEINRKLLRIIENNSGERKISKKKSGKIETKNELNDVENKNIENNKFTTSIPQSPETMNNNSGQFGLIPNAYKRNWLQISTDKYKENIKLTKKRKLINLYYSQPVLGSRISEDTDLEFKGLSFYNLSQP